jgi:hypothetical protein
MYKINICHLKIEQNRTIAMPLLFDFSLLLYTSRSFGIITNVAYAYYFDTKTSNFFESRKKSFV